MYASNINPAILLEERQNDYSARPKSEPFKRIHKYFEKPPPLKLRKKLGYAIFTLKL